VLALFFFACIVFVVALAGSRFKPDAWYAALAKPSWTPPNWLFAPVWSVLYICIAVAGWLVWRAADDSWSTALTIWTLQLAANGIWTWLFFGRHRIDLALIDIGLTLVLIVAFMAEAQELNTIAALQFLPYLIWVSFAATLNVAIWRLNRPQILARRLES
jgi:translocator protein